MSDFDNLNEKLMVFELSPESQIQNMTTLRSPLITPGLLWSLLVASDHPWLPLWKILYHVQSVLMCPAGLRAETESARPGERTMRAQHAFEQQLSPPGLEKHTICAQQAFEQKLSPHGLESAQCVPSRP